jgi:FKBP-type peptidyl-prolyl cis-trans isomerase 2
MWLQTEGWQDAEVGVTAQVRAGSNTFLVKVAAVSEEAIKLDANSPLAGQDIKFEVTVKDVTPAKQVERITFGGGAALSMAHLHAVSACGTCLQQLACAASHEKYRSPPEHPSRHGGVGGTGS